MRTPHTAHPLLAFPVYSSAFLSADKLVLGGGGGASRSGIKNKLRLYRVHDDRKIDLLDELELEKGEDAPMSMAAHIESESLVCGINSVQEKIMQGQNENCRVYSLTGDDHRLMQTRSRGTLSNPSGEDYQKVTVLSPDGSSLVVAGTRDFSLLNFPSLSSAAQPVQISKGEIYDATFSSSHVIIATSLSLLVYSLPSAIVPSSQDSVDSEKGSKGKKKGKQKGKAREKQAENLGENALPELEFVKTVNVPELPGLMAGATATFRAVRFHPIHSNSLYTILNTSTPRKPNTKTIKRQAYVTVWKVTVDETPEKSENACTIEMGKARRVSEGGVTCFEFSPDGKFLAFGASDCSIGLLDAKTLNPFLAILKAHEFPPTTLRFSPASNLLVSGSADSTVRIVSVPSELAGQSWTTVLLIALALIIVLIAIAMQAMKYVY